LNDAVVLPGVSYEFIQFPTDARSRTTVEYIVDSNYFKQLALDMGLELVSRENFLTISEIEEDRKQFDKSELAVTALYTTYKFRKTVETPQSLAKIPSLLKYNESLKQYQATLNVLSFGVAEKLGSFKQGLIVSPENVFPIPAETEYTKLHMLTQDIDQVKGLYQQLQSKGKKISERERVFVSKLPREMYDMIYLSNTVSNQFETFLGQLVEGGSITGSFIPDTVELPNGETQFANFVFDITLDRLNGLYAINGDVEDQMLPLVNIQTSSPIQYSAYSRPNRHRVQKVFIRYSIRFSRLAISALTRSFSASSLFFLASA
jgi:hypothetical protein